MSKIFYDHLIIIEEIWDEVESLPLHAHEKQSAKKLADEYVHHRVLTLILDLLPRDHHEDFLNRFHHAPHDVLHLKYLEEKIGKQIHQEISTLGKKLKQELSRELKKHKKPNPIHHKRGKGS